MPSTYNASAYRLWNVSDKVGPGCKNNRADVLLVQVFLVCAKDYLNDNSSNFSAFDYPYPNYSGVCDQQTVAGIMGFQRYSRSTQGGATVVDGVVSRMHAGTVGYADHVAFTIAKLGNVFYRYEFGYSIDKKPVVSDFNWLMANMWTGDGLPGELVGALGPANQHWS